MALRRARRSFPRRNCLAVIPTEISGRRLSVQARRNVNGWEGSLGVNLNHWFGLVSDFSGHYGSFNVIIPPPPLPCVFPGCSQITISENDKFHSFLFGPQFSLRARKLTPFAHALFGGSRLNRSGTETIVPPLPLPPISNISFSTSSTNFAFAGGGGLDYKLSGKLAWRVQADYLEIGIPNRTLNNVRVSTGLVFHF